MARIKFNTEDFSGFGAQQQYYKPVLIQESDPSKVINTIRQGVAGAVEVAGAAKDFADFLTKSGVIGGQPTKEDLMKEAAKKKAEEARKLTEQERTKLVSEQEAQRKEAEALQAPYQAGTVDTTIQGQAENRKAFIASVIPAYQSGKIDENSFNVEVAKAEKAGTISVAEAEALRQQVAAQKKGIADAQAEAQKAKSAKEAAAQALMGVKGQGELALQQQSNIVAEREKARQALLAPRTNEAADEEEKLLALDKQDYAQRLAAKTDPTEPQMVELQNSIANREAFIREMRSPNPDPLKLKEASDAVASSQQRLEQEKQRVAAETKQAEAAIPAAQQAELAAQKVAEERAKAARVVTAPAVQQNMEDYVRSLSKEQAAKLYVQAMSATTRDRTKSAQDFALAVNKVYPDVAKDFLTTQPKAGVSPAADRTRQGEVLEASTVQDQLNAYKKAAPQRKADIAKAVDLDIEQKQQQLANIDRALAAYDADPVAAEGAFKKAVEAINGIRGKDRKAIQNKADLEAAKQELQQYIGGAVQKKQELDQSEDARNAALEKGVMSFIEATAELQGLNDARAKQGGLTANQAARMVQLRHYLDDNKQFQEKLMSVDVANNPNIRQFVTDLSKQFFDGKAPAPETQEERDARFNDELKVFDDRTQQLIKQAAVQGAKEIGDNYVDADQLKMLAVKAALTGKKEDAALVLGALASGKVVGMQPNSLTDWLSGDYKTRFNNDIFQTLFTRVRGKSDEEIAIALQNLELKNINTIRQVADTLSNLEKRTYELEDKKAMEEDRRQKADAERRLKEAQAKEAEFKSGQEYLDAELAKLKGQAQEAGVKGENAQRWGDAKMAASLAMAKYYSKKNDYALAIAKAGENAAALNATGRNLDDHANDIGKLKGAETDQYGKLSQYEDYVEKDASGKPVPSQKWKDEFGANEKEFEKKLQNVQGTRAKDIFAKRYEEAKLYRDKFGKPDFVDKPTYEVKSTTYDKAQAGMRELASILQSGKISRTGSDAPNKIGSVIAAETEIQKVVDDIAAGKIKTPAEKDAAFKRVDDAVKKVKTELGISTTP